MGESFKLHSQALIGYVDELSIDHVTGMQVDQNLMDIATTY